MIAVNKADLIEEAKQAVVDYPDWTLGTDQLKQRELSPLTCSICGQETDVVCRIYFNGEEPGYCEDCLRAAIHKISVRRKNS